MYIREKNYVHKEKNYGYKGKKLRSYPMLWYNKSIEKYHD